MNDPLTDSLGIEPEFDKMDEIRRKKQEVYENDIESKYDNLIKRKNELATNDDIDLTSMSEERLNNIVSETSEYLELARNSKTFLNNNFNGVVPYFARNVILIAAPTGHGKSTTCANLAYHALLQGQKILVITNEEVAGDVYNRIICLIKGWAYVDHGKFTDDQVRTFKEMIPQIGKRVTVVDDNFGGSPGQTTTIEGMEAIFESLVKKKTNYGVIIFDYYQNVTKSNKNSSWNNWQCQEYLAKYLDSYKSRYNAPIIVLAQLLDYSDNKPSFKERIEGRKLILNTATCAIELSAERDDQRTAWTIRKSRFSEGVGDTIYTGFSKGKYVEYTPKFANEAELYKAEKKHRSLFGEVFKGTGENNEK